IEVSDLSIIIAVVSAVIAVGYFALLLKSKKVSSRERSRIIGFIPMFLASVAFWSLFQQQNTTLAKFLAIGGQTGVTSTGWSRAVSWTEAINPLFVIIFAGIFVYIWMKYRSDGLATTVKFAIALAIMGVSFFVLIPMSVEVGNPAV